MRLNDNITITLFAATAKDTRGVCYFNYKNWARVMEVSKLCT